MECVSMISPPASLFLRRVVDQRPIQAAGIALLLVQHCPVSYQVAKCIVHWRSEAQSGHEPGGGVRCHESQSPAVRRVGQPQRVQSQVCAQRVGARVCAKVRCVWLQRRKRRAVAERHSPGEHGPRRGCCGCGCCRRLLRILEHPLCRPRLVWPGLVGALSAAVVEDLLDGLHHIFATALQDELQDASLVAGKYSGEDVDGVHVPRGRRGRGRLLLVFVGLRTRIRADGADGPWSFFSVFQRLGYR